MVSQFELINKTNYSNFSQADFNEFSLQPNFPNGFEFSQENTRVHYVQFTTKNSTWLTSISTIPCYSTNGLSSRMNLSGTGAKNQPKNKPYTVTNLFIYFSVNYLNTGHKLNCTPGWSQSQNYSSDIRTITLKDKKLSYRIASLLIWYKKEIYHERGFRYYVNHSILRIYGLVYLP